MSLAVNACLLVQVQVFRLDMGISLEHLSVGMPGKHRHLFDAVFHFKQAGNRFMPKIVEVQIFNAQFALMLEADEVVADCRAAQRFITANRMAP